MTDKPKVAGAKLGIGEMYWHRADHNVEKAAVNGLTMAGEGFFHRLRRLYVWRAGRLPHDPSTICTDVGCKTVRSFNSALGELVDAGCVFIEDGMIRFPYVDALIAEVQESRDKKANAGSIGGTAKAEAHRNISETSEKSDPSLDEVSPKFGPSFGETSPKQGSESEQNQPLGSSNNYITNNYQLEEKKDPPMPPDRGAVITSHFRALSAVGYSDVCLASGQDLAATAAAPDLFGGEPSVPTKPTKPTKPKRSRRQVDYSADFLRFWELNPDRGPDGHNKKRSKANWEAAIEGGASPEDMIRGWGVYAESKRTSTDWGTQWVKSAQNFLDPEEKMWTRFQTAPNVHQLRPNQHHSHNGFDQQPRKPKLAGVMG